MFTSLYDFAADHFLLRIRVRGAGTFAISRVEKFVVVGIVHRVAAFRAHVRRALPTFQSGSCKEKNSDEFQPNSSFKLFLSAETILA